MNALRKTIKKALDGVTKDNAPNVYAAIQTENGYKTIEDMIINMMIDNNFTASGCIPQIEEMI